MERTVIHPNEVNESMNAQKSIKSEIKPGMTATMFVGSDRYAMVVTQVNSPKTIKVAHMFDFDYEKNMITNEDGVQYLPEAEMEKYKLSEKLSDYYKGHIYTLRKNGRWMPKGVSMWGTCSVHVGNADNYRDPSF